MPASFHALRDDCIDAAFAKPARLFYGGGGGENFRARRPDALLQAGRGQAEMKTDDRRAHLLDHIHHCFAEGQTRRRG